MSRSSAGEITNRMVIIGGSYAGLCAAFYLLDLHHNVAPRDSPVPYVREESWPATRFHITIIDERDGFFHLIGAPLAMADYDYTHKAWTKFSAVKDLQSPNVKVLQGTVTNVDCVAKQVAYLPQGCQLQQVIDYDYMVVSTGMRRDWPVVPRSVTYSDYLHEVGNHIEQLQDAQYGVVVVGGGAVGIEVAAELKLVMPHLKVTLVHSREKLMSSEPLTDECKQRALEVLRRANVDVILNRRFVIQEPIKTPDSTGKYQVNFSDGSHMQASAVVMAISNGVPSTHFLPTTALDEQGYVRIRANLMFPAETPNADYHFSAGDVVRWSGLQRVGRAKRAGYRAAINLHQHVLQEKMSNYEAKYSMLTEARNIIVLAIGREAVMGTPESTSSGEDVMERSFGNDLGLSQSKAWLGVATSASL